MRNRTLQQALKGAAKVAHRRAFKKKLPFAYSIDGQVFLVYPDHSKVKVNSAQIEQLTPNSF
jgi:hypothetical protein